VAAALPADSALVAFVRYVTKNRKPEPPGKPSTLEEVPAYLAFVLRGGQTEPRIVPLGPAGEIENLAAQWRKELAVEAMAPRRATKLTEVSYRAAAARLRRRVWDTIAISLGGGKRVFVVPDGVINLVNFYSLPVAHSRYLIETGPTIHYLPAERDLVLPENQVSGRGLLAIGNPAFNERGLFASLTPKPKAPVENEPGLFSATGSYRGTTSVCGDFRALHFGFLAGSEQEVDQIVRVWRKRTPISDSSSSALRLVGEQANEMEFKREAPGKRVLHLATHGFFLGQQCPSALETVSKTDESGESGSAGGENPLLLSGLALAGANNREAAGAEEEDGILTAEEIAAMDLRGVEWAVLSACDTGLGKVMSGEGVLGLERAFQIAGARTVIMSLWPVEDTVAREWMTTVYGERFRSGLDTASAVRQADLKLLRQARTKQLSTHPFYWAAFVAAGDWR
jgi:hypothetical protein